MFHGAIPPLPAPGQHPPVLKCAAEAVARSLVRAVKGEHGTLEATGATWDHGMKDLEIASGYDYMI